MQNNKHTELYSSAFTMSDMEIFVFPELLYAMVLANIMSPNIWKWLEDPWFSNLDRLNYNKKLHRLKQYIMDNYSFNLDLETWGLTTREKELKRFTPFISPDVISESNALFGYEGDKYYFSIDIRRHFGLDKYNSNIIPYWKTETIEAMDAFRFKKHHKTGAGECVSLSALYAAAMFIVLKIPLEDIFLIATPLHSQNFILVNSGVITNNRRILTKRMWFNGTILSDKARRALENEKVSYISHISGHIHSVYREATINRTMYSGFKKSLTEFLHTEIDGETFVNFLRVNGKYRKYFQFLFENKGRKQYITAEKLYEYEHNSKNRIDDNSRKKLFEEVDMDDFDLSEIPGRYLINELEEKFNINIFSCERKESIEFWKNELSEIPLIDDMISDLKKFSCIKAMLPDENSKIFIEHIPLTITINEKPDRQYILDYLSSMRKDSLLADLAFFAGRYCSEKEWPYFLKSALERNPVSINYFNNKPADEVYNSLLSMENISIYDRNRFAQPDEVVNFGRGDGIEKAFTLANILLNRKSGIPAEIICNGNTITLVHEGNRFGFQSDKSVKGRFLIDLNKGEYLFES